MLKVCIDTNIWISGILFGGPPAKIVDIALSRRRIQSITSIPILIEIERTLVSKFNFKSRTAKRLCYRIAEAADLYEPSGELKIPSLSRADTLVVETANLGKARYLVTGDQALLALKHYKLTRIIEASHLIQLLRLS